MIAIQKRFSGLADLNNRIESATVLHTVDDSGDLVDLNNRIERLLLLVVNIHGYIFGSKQ